MHYLIAKKCRNNQIINLFYLALASYTSFIVDPRTLESGEISEVRQSAVSVAPPLYIPETPVVKRRRGRPRKVKVEDLSMCSEDNMSYQSNDMPQLLGMSDDIKEEHPPSSDSVEIIDDVSQEDNSNDSPQFRRSTM